jgi:hypothetical protein
MFEYIEWTLFIRARTRDKALKVLRWFEEAAQHDATIVECEQYWKDKSLFRAVVTTPLGIENVAEAVFETLLTCSQIATPRIVNAPQAYTDNRWEFGGSPDTGGVISVVGISAVSFRIRNFEEPTGI